MHLWESDTWSFSKPSAFWQLHYITISDRSSTLSLGTKHLTLPHLTTCWNHARLNLWCSWPSHQLVCFYSLPPRRHLGTRAAVIAVVEWGWTADPTGMLNLPLPLKYELRHALCYHGLFYYDSEIKFSISSNFFSSAAHFSSTIVRVGCTKDFL